MGGQSTQCFNGLGLRLSKCQHFQEMSTKPGTVSTISGRLSTRSVNRLSTTSGNKQELSTEIRKRQYNLPSVNLLSAWIQSCLSPLEIHEKCASLPRETPQMDVSMSKDVVQSADQEALIEAQRRQIEKLEKQLKYSQDKVLALNTLIDIAEEQGIRIRKKPGAKQ